MVCRGKWWFAQGADRKLRQSIEKLERRKKDKFEKDKNFKEINSEIGWHQVGFLNVQP